MSRHICQILLGVGILVELPIPTYIDNEGVVKALGNVTHESSSKHIDIRLFWMKDDIEQGIFDPLHVLSGDNLADALTKALGGPKFWTLMDDLMGLQITKAGQRMRQGLPAYRADEIKNKHRDKTKVKLCAQLPGPELGDYYGFPDPSARSSISELRRLGNNHQ